MEDIEDRAIDELNATKPWWMAVEMYLARLDWYLAAALRPLWYQR